MAKKPKNPKGEPKKKAISDQAPAAPAPVQASEPSPRPMLRAVKVTTALLEAAKAYKKATGTSFYALGFESIAERLTREGYLPKEVPESQS